MNNKLAYRKNQTEALILLFKALEVKSLEDNFSEVFLFLARYSFLFENTENSVNSCTLEASQIYTEQAFSDWSVKYIDLVLKEFPDKKGNMYLISRYRNGQKLDSFNFKHSENEILTVTLDAVLYDKEGKTFSKSLQYILH